MHLLVLMEATMMEAPDSSRRWKIFGAQYDCQRGYELFYVQFRGKMRNFFFFFLKRGTP